MTGQLESAVTLGIELLFTRNTRQANILCDTAENVACLRSRILIKMSHMYTGSVHTSLLSRKTALRTCLRKVQQVNQLIGWPAISCALLILSYRRIFCGAVARLWIVGARYRGSIPGRQEIYFFSEAGTGGGKYLSFYRQINKEWNNDSSPLVRLHVCTWKVFTFPVLFFGFLFLVANFSVRRRFCSSQQTTAPAQIPPVYLLHFHVLSVNSCSKTHKLQQQNPEPVTKEPDLYASFNNHRSLSKPHSKLLKVHGEG